MYVLVEVSPSVMSRSARSLMLVYMLHEGFWGYSTQGSRSAQHLPIHQRPSFHDT